MERALLQVETYGMKGCYSWFFMFGVLGSGPPDPLDPPNPRFPTASRRRRETEELSPGPRPKNHLQGAPSAGPSSGGAFAFGIPNRKKWDPQAVSDARSEGGGGGGGWCREEYRHGWVGKGGLFYGLPVAGRRCVYSIIL